MIKREGTKFILKSKDGKRKLGEFDTLEEAREREKKIKFFAKKGEFIDTDAEKGKEE